MAGVIASQAGPDAAAADLARRAAIDSGRCNPPRHRSRRPIRATGVPPACVRARTRRTSASHSSYRCKFTFFARRWTRLFSYPSPPTHTRHPDTPFHSKRLACVFRLATATPSGSVALQDARHAGSLPALQFTIRRSCPRPCFPHATRSPSPTGHVRGRTDSRRPADLLSSPRLRCHPVARHPPDPATSRSSPRRDLK